MRILVADRSLEHLRTVAALVSRHAPDATLVVAQSPSEALAAAGLEVPDLLIIGARMRDASVIIDCLRDQGVGRTTVVVLLSTHDRRALCRGVLERADITIGKEHVDRELPPILERSRVTVSKTGA